MKILIVEDEAQKLNELIFFFRSLPSAEYESARSVRAALDYFREGGHADLMILDMSLPTFDIDESESGGTPRPFGGIDVLRNLDRLDIAIPTVVLTGYQSFEDESRVISLQELGGSMREEFGEFLLDVVQYTPFSNDWMEKLRVIYNNRENLR